MKRMIFPVVFSILVFSVSVIAQAERKDGRVYWRGSVDDKVHLVIKGLTLEVKTVTGRAAAPGNHSFTARLPRVPVTVVGARVEGRGRIAVIQQPTAENDFTAIVEITDDRGGAGEYLLDISWS